MLLLRPGRIIALGLLTATLLTFPARANYPWPADGAPVCNAPGDQHLLFHSFTACGTWVSWVHSVPGADTIVASGFGPIPPAGDCLPINDLGVDATGVTEASGSYVHDGIILGVPGVCIGPRGAQVWLQGSGASLQLVVNVPIWMWESHTRQVVDEGDAVRHHPRMSGSGQWFADTALVVVWSDERTGVSQIRAQRVTQGGIKEWGPSGLLIAPTSAAQTHPEVARTFGGGSLIMWLDARSGGSDVYALLLLPDGSLAPGWPAGGLALEARAELPANPRFVDTGSFHRPAFVVWEESGPRFGGGRSIVARKLLEDGTPDPAWSPDGVPLTTSSTVEQLQDVSFTGAGLVAVWTDLRSATVGNPNDLYAQWLEPTGLPASGWPASGLALCTATGAQDAAKVSATSSYAAFAWEDHRGADADIYAMLRKSDGSLPCCLWQPDGIPATSATGDQTTPAVGAGNGGGAFVAWVDARDQGTLGLDLYAQAFSSEGEKLDVPPGGTSGSALLGPPRPNPSRGSSAWTIELPRAGDIVVEVIDLLGRRVRTIARGGFPAGPSTLSFDGRDDAGRELPPSVYRVRARFGGVTESRALILFH